MADFADARQQSVGIFAGHAELLSLVDQYAVVHAVELADLALHLGGAVRAAEVLQGVYPFYAVRARAMAVLLSVAVLLSAGAAVVVMVVMLVLVAAGAAVVVMVVMLVLVAAGATVVVMMVMLVLMIAAAAARFRMMTLFGCMFVRHL